MKYKRIDYVDAILYNGNNFDEIKDFCESLKIHMFEVRKQGDELIISSRVYCLTRHLRKDEFLIVAPNLVVTMDKSSFNLAYQPVDNHDFYSPYTIKELVREGWDYSDATDTFWMSTPNEEGVIILKPDLKVVHNQQYGDVEHFISFLTGPYNTFEEAKKYAESIIKKIKLKTEIKNNMCDIDTIQYTINMLLKSVYPKFDPKIHTVDANCNCESSPIGCCIYASNSMDRLFHNRCLFCNKKNSKE